MEEILILIQEYFGKLNRRQGEYAKGILEASNGLMSMLSNIFDIASIQAGNLKLNRKRIDVHGLLVSILNLTSDRASEKNINLEFDCSPDIGWILADEIRLKQVIFNLMSNAVIFTPEQGTVRLESRRENNNLVIISGLWKPERSRSPTVIEVLSVDFSKSTINVDGENIGSTPLQMEVLSNAVQICVPN